MRNILPTNIVVSTSVPVHGLTQLGFSSHPSGSSVPEAITVSLSFFRSDKPVYSTASIRQVGPCQPTSAMAGPIFSYFGSPNLAFPGRPYDFYGRLYAGVGCPYGGFPNFWDLDPLGPPAPFELFRAQGGNRCPTSLAFSAPAHQVLIPTDNTTGVFYINKQGGNPFPSLVASSSGSLYVALSSEHSSQSQAHPRLFERDSRPPIQIQSARVESPFRNRESNFLDFGELRQWTCLPQSTTPAFLSSCLRFRSH